ncbi:MAG TPA: carbonate dehydratase [Opitutales bacterium]|nr:carbonate dehydratase [Opitutales bacterium]
MRSLSHLFDQNKTWAARMREKDAQFFERLCDVQKPQYLWIGCSDSRVSADQVVDVLPGQIFVHRNVANLAVHTDINLLSVLQYAVHVLKVEHVIVCGHYGCGGIRAVIDGEKLGLIDNWLRHVKDIYNKNRAELDLEADLDRRTDLLCELNVAAQVRNVAHTTIIQDAWKAGQSVSIHGWIYSLKDGLLRDLEVGIECRREIDPEYRI